ncbi:60256065-94d0-4055-a1e5-ca8724674e66 [Thermothielavioides terrestris]|uniref:60256065-94d0-4055-a1e5-ca8724674e66 n=1 Tax=Thermothielavioides terrestris TaxID=2587410 RepID=A0A3S5CWR0_9PEZI|nr:60256065-94d0-4055-a1e5-ca8724674e66 [Thermothielavioides terrestris]
MAWTRLWRACLVAAITAAVNLYKPGYPSFDPGGQTLPPPVPGGPLLQVLVQPRYSLYLDSEQYGEFVVNAELSQFQGTPWPNTTSTSKWANRLIFSINLVEDDEPLVENTVAVNSTGNLFRFELSRLKPSLDPIQVVLYGAPEEGTPTWTATTSLFYLPDKTDGSITRIDNLHGGLWFRNAATNHQFTPFFPFGFYASYDGFLRTNDTAPIDHYSSLGLTAMTPLTTFADSAAVLTYISAHTPVRLMYDLREGYKNLSYVRANVLAARASPALFAYWTADEPDGWQDPFAAPEQARDLIRALDPYHPVAVTLNCADYYFGPYSAAADLLMADVYPIGINSTFSKWGTVCNATYGDCGCDRCEGVVGDVVTRLEDWARFERYLGRWPKTKLFNPQAFHGEDYWLRDPSTEETWVMIALAVNHGAKGSIAWVWPPSDVLAEAHGKMATVLTGEDVVGFIVGGDGPRRIEVDVPGTEVVDVACWVAGGKMLVSVVNGGYVPVEGGVEVPVPNATVIESTPWGSVQWKLEGGKLSVPLLPALATSMVILNLRG